MEENRGSGLSRIIVDQDYCKGCGLCVDVCPKQIIVLDTSIISQKGYNPALLTDESQCIGCGMCATMCPDMAITVEK
jgi:2-oxoglutarate ferredoxin oxidoreductase subunit delta